MITSNYFLGSIFVLIGEYQNRVAVRLIARDQEHALETLESYAQCYYGDENTPREDGGYYANNAEVYVQASSVQPISKSAFDELTTIPKYELEEFSENEPTEPSQQAQEGVQATSGDSGDATEEERLCYAIVGRLLFDDEDSCYTYENVTKSQALMRFECDMLEDSDLSVEEGQEGQIIVNLVLTSKTPIDSQSVA